MHIKNTNLMTQVTFSAKVEHEPAASRQRTHPAREGPLEAAGEDPAVLQGLAAGARGARRVLLGLRKCILRKILQFFTGSFFAVSKPIFATTTTKNAFCSMF